MIVLQKLPTGTMAPPPPKKKKSQVKNDQNPKSKKKKILKCSLTLFFMFLWSKRKFWSTSHNKFCLWKNEIFGMAPPPPQSWRGPFQKAYWGFWWFLEGPTWSPQKWYRMVPGLPHTSFYDSLVVFEPILTDFDISRFLHTPATAVFSSIFGLV